MHNPALSELYHDSSSGVCSQLRHTSTIHPRRPSVFDRHIERQAAVEQ
ncbi:MULTISPECIES: hypothetical protein [Pseudomonas]|nr:MULTISPECIES: hypothetical protein [Pseudomonas]NMY37613.1 hypothetical protein [Pseudomonas sp. WS 5078]NMY60354.1 hypothetical protein [Pseudomonas sp. WS 5354]